MLNSTGLKNKQEEVDSLAKDIKRFKSVIYLAREPLLTHINTLFPAYNAEGILPNIEEKNISIFCVYHQAGQEAKEILKNMLSIKQQGGLICTVTNGMSWGWAHKYTDYGFILPSIDERQLIELYMEILRELKFQLEKSS